MRYANDLLHNLELKQRIRVAENKVNFPVLSPKLYSEFNKIVEKCAEVGESYVK